MHYLMMATHNFAVEVDLLAPVLARAGTANFRAWLLGIDLGEEGLADLVLLEVVLPMLPNTLLRSEHSLAALVLAVEVFSVLHIALLEATAFLGIEAKQVVLPGILGHIVGHRLMHPHVLLVGRTTVGVSRRQRLRQRLVCFSK